MLSDYYVLSALRSKCLRLLYLVVSFIVTTGAYRFMVVFGSRRLSASGEGLIL